jgi:hypothetical protein
VILVVAHGVSRIAGNTHLTSGFRSYEKKTTVSLANTLRLASEYGGKRIGRHCLQRVNNTLSPWVPRRAVEYNHVQEVCSLACVLKVLFEARRLSRPGRPTTKLRVDDRVSLKGEKKPSKVKVSRLFKSAKATRRWCLTQPRLSIAWPRKKTRFAGRPQPPV